MIHCVTVYVRRIVYDCAADVWTYVFVAEIVCVCLVNLKVMGQHDNLYSQCRGTIENKRYTPRGVKY